MVLEGRVCQRLNGMLGLSHLGTGHIWMMQIHSQDVGLYTCLLLCIYSLLLLVPFCRFACWIDAVRASITATCSYCYRMLLAKAACNALVRSCSDLSLTTAQSVQVQLLGTVLLLTCPVCLRCTVQAASPAIRPKLYIQPSCAHWELLNTL